MTRDNLKTAKAEGGVAAVEFALILPLLLLLIFGIIEIGIVFFHWIIISGEMDTVARWVAVRTTISSSVCPDGCQACNGSQSAQEFFDTKVRPVLGVDSLNQTRAAINTCFVDPTTGVVTLGATDQIPLITPLMKFILAKDPNAPGITLMKQIYVTAER
jgi:Flp pilus assembly protein TadG